MHQPKTSISCIVTVITVILLSALNAVAYDFSVGGIYYLINTSSTNTVSVTYGTSSTNSYSGNVRIPSTVTYGGTTYNVTGISSSAFYYCDGLTSVSIPKTITSISSYAFDYCTGLKSVYVEDLSAWLNTSISSNPLKYAGNLYVNNELLTCFTLPNSWKYSSVAMHGCKSIKKIVVPSGVGYISFGVFSGCSNVDIFVIQDGSSTLELETKSGSYGPYGIYDYDYGFFYQLTLNEMYIGRNIKTYLPLFEYDDDGDLYYSWGHLKKVEIGPSVNKLQKLFNGCPALSSVILHNNLVEIESYALSGCKSLKSLVIPANVNKIGNYAFSNCTSLQSITLPENLKTIESNVFKGCTSLDSVEISDNLKCIRTDAFNGCTKLSSIKLPCALDSLHIKAFNGCTSLSKVIYDCENCKYLGTATNSAFDGCTITALEIGPHVKSIPNYSFIDFTDLSNLCIPSNVNSISQYAFKGSNNIETLEYYGSSSAFSNLLSSIKSAKLFKATLGGNFSIIPASAFSNCTGLTSIEICDGVETIGANAFSGCSSLSAVYAKSITVPGAAASAFSNNAYKDCVLYVPIESYQKYATTIPWSNFLNIQAKSDVNYNLVINTSSLSLTIGNTYQLQAYYEPSISSTPSVTWTTTNSNVATVDENGLVKAIGIGEAVIKGQDITGKEVSCHITVEPIIATESFGISIDNQDVRRGRTTLIPVLMHNEDGVVSFQCDITLPDGVTLEKTNGQYAITLGDRCAGQTLTSSDLDGSVRVLCFSPTNAPVKGNDGAVFYLPLEVPESMAIGTQLNINISGVLITKQGTFEEVAGANSTATLNVIKCYTLGDVNDDGKISAADISMTVEYIMGRTPSNSIREAADVNEDGKVSAADISIIVSKILSGSSKAPARIVSRDKNTDNIEDHLTLDINDDGDLNVKLTNARSYTAVQFDVKLPNGFLIKDISFADMLTDHVITYDLIDGGVARIIIYSPSNSRFMSDGALINMSLCSVEGIVSEWINVDNVLLVVKEGTNINEYEAEGDSLLYEMSSLKGIGNERGLSVKTERGYIVLASDQDTTVVISNTKGQHYQVNLHAGENRIPVGKGIYLVGGYKIVVR